MSSNITPENFFLVRVPRLPINKIFELPYDSKEIREEIKQWVADERVKEALYIASPSLVGRLDKWLTNPEAKSSKKIEYSLIKYFIRMSSRPTPFGLFSGVSLGRITSETALKVSHLKEDNRCTRLDMFYLSTLQDHIQKNEYIKSALTFKVNTSLHKVGNKYHYIEKAQDREKRIYQLSSANDDQYFRLVLSLVGDGLNYKDIIESFKSVFPEFSTEEIESYVQSLVEEQCIIVDLPLKMLGRSPDKQFVESLSNLKLDIYAEKLDQAISKIEAIDASHTATIDEYRGIQSTLSKLGAPTKENRLFQVDTYRSFEQLSLDKSIINRLKKHLMLLYKASYRKKDIFGEFINSFNQRFEGQMVPLLTALDDESGIIFSNESGYDSKLLEGLAFNNQSPLNNQTRFETALDVYICEVVSQPCNLGKEVVSLSSAQLNKRIVKRDVDIHLPRSFAAAFSLHKDKQGNDLIALNGSYGPTAARLLGRFCHLNGELKNEVIHHLDKESSELDDVIYAEINHMPDGRPGNVIARPNLRKYEITFLGDSSIDDDFQIPVSDLHILIENRVIKLWSKKLNKQVIPRLSCAHNYSQRSLGVYKFLSMLQEQESYMPDVSLPQRLNSFVYLPRIMLDDMVLFRKRWIVQRTELVALIANESIIETKYLALKNKYQLDDFVEFSRGDNRLIVNLRNPVLLTVLLKETSNLELLELKETLYQKFDSSVTDSYSKEYSNEFIIPFFNDKIVTKKINSALTSKESEHVAKRNFLPGSEWLSLKIYAGNSMLDELLSGKLIDLINKHKTNISKWFFIRYGDPDWHLRIRILGEPEYLYSKLLKDLNELFSPLLDKLEIKRVELFTYVRELERYGGKELISFAESLFSFDSELICNTLQGVDVYGEDFRWKVSLAYIDSLLDLLRFDEAEKFEFVSRQRDLFGIEFGDSGLQRKLLGKKFKKLSEGFLSATHSKPGIKDIRNQSEVAVIIKQWNDISSSVLTEVNTIYKKSSALSCSKSSLVASLIHMHINRMYMSNNREHELVIYDILRRAFLIQLKSSN